MKPLVTMDGFEIYYAIFAISLFVIGVIIIVREMFREHLDEINPNDCTNCKHLCYNSDGSVECDSPFEKSCLSSDIRIYKDPVNKN